MPRKDNRNGTIRVYVLEISGGYATVLYKNREFYVPEVALGNQKKGYVWISVDWIEANDE